MKKNSKKLKKFCRDTMSRILLIFLFTFLTLSAYTQSPPADTVVAIPKKTKHAHSPTRAGIYSAVLPGLGQIYNRKWWKTPIVYAAIGTSAGFVVYNQRKYRMFKTAYINHFNDPLLQDDFSKYSLGQLFEIQDTYHEWRDISIMFLAGAYVLNIIDAVVDAHFFRFDVDDKLSFHFQPRLGNYASTFGFSLRF
ncbi:MAG: DUF5683 domain-containing protein [Flavobacteriales bacterium]